jgi:hypothetical protein
MRDWDVSSDDRTGMGFLAIRRQTTTRQLLSQFAILGTIEDLFKRGSQIGTLTGLKLYEGSLAEAARHDAATQHVHRFPGLSANRPPGMLSGVLKIDIGKKEEPSCFGAGTRTLDGSEHFLFFE